MILTRTTDQLTVDIDISIKSLYTNYETYINNTLIGTTLPITTTITKGVQDIKVILKNLSGSYEDNRCYLYDEDIVCQIVSYIKNLSKDERTINNISFLYYLLLEGTKESTLCSCFCDDLKLIYSDITDLLLLDDCNC